VTETVPTRSGRRGSQPPGSQDSAPLAFAASAPHTVIDAITESVFEATFLHRTTFADTFRDLDADAI